MLEQFGNAGLDVRRFTRPGPIGSAYMASRARVVGIMGPQGGGKTTVTINRLLTKAAMQPPSPIDGVARYRAVIWMRTYRELWSKVIPDWLEWVPKDSKAFGISWSGGVDNPADHRFTFRAIAGGREHVVKAEFWFRAIGEQTPTEAAKGLHATDGWLPEATSATAEMRKALFGRLGRYPQEKHGGAPHRQLFCDWNAGDPYNWTSEYFITHRPLDLDDEGRAMVEFFRQPGGRDPDAENLHNLPRTYYSDQVAANADDPDWIRRMVDNRIGFMRDGKPVLDQFHEDLHVSDMELTPWRGVPLVLAADAGLTPAAVIGQRKSIGENQILAEITSTRADAETFGEAINAVLDHPRFAGCIKPSEIFVDPTALDAKESSAREESGEGLATWAKIVAKKTGLKVVPSRCKNDPVARVTAVNAMFRRRVPGEHRPACVIDRTHCAELIKACARDYKYKKVEVAGMAGAEFQERPVKNFASHVGNALEYYAGNVGEQDLVTGKTERLEKRRQEHAARAKAAQRSAAPSDPLAAYGGQL